MGGRFRWWGFSSESQYREGFGPFAPGFRAVPFGDAEALRAAIGPNTVGFLVEPVQGEAGIVVPVAGYLREVRAICTENRVLMMCDEIQSGLGRTGKMFAFEHEGIRPDVCIVGKALSGGFYPVSAVLASARGAGGVCAGRSWVDVWGQSAGVRGCAGGPEGDRGRAAGGAVGGAWGVCAGAAEGVQEQQGQTEVRGKGLWIGIELNVAARPICEELMRRGVLCKETHATVIRLAPPLVIAREDLEWGLGEIEAAIGA